MKMGRGHGLTLCHCPGVQLGTDLSVCMESGGNEVDANLEGDREMRLCPSA